MKRPIFLAPFALLLIGPVAAASLGPMTPSVLLPTPRLPPQDQAAAWDNRVWRQVRIEQHLSIRISPGTASMPPDVVEELEEEKRPNAARRPEERKIGKCLAIASIAAVQPGDGDELLLFLRDQRIISLKLEKQCVARAFYSGFYVKRDADGALCAGRDILQSRSGTNCRVRRLNELVPSGYRRIP